MSSKPGEEFEVRQTSTSEDYTPDPSKSIKLSPQRQALIDDIIALYSCEPTVRRVERYTADCVYDDQFGICILAVNIRDIVLIDMSSIRQRPLQDGWTMVCSAQALQGEQERALRDHQE